MRKRNATKPRRMRKTPRGKAAELVLAPLHQPSRTHLPDVKYRRLWP